MTALTPHPVLLQLGIFPITAHGLFFALGAEVGYLALYGLARRRKLETEWLAERVLLVFVAGLVAARIGFFIVYPSAFQSVAQVLEIWQGGLVSFFGILGGLGAAYVAFPKRRSEWLGLVSVAALAAWGVGRLGNFWAGDSVGVLSAHWAYFYGRVPIQLFESVLCLVALGYWYRRAGAARLVSKVVLTYLAIRFLVDFWRDEGAWGGLHLGQWVCLAAAVPLAVYLLRKRND